MSKEPDERFDKIVQALSKRMASLLRKEACVGTSSRLVGASRLKPDELAQRLELLRDQLLISVELCESAAQNEPKFFQVTLLRKNLKSVRKALDRPTFKGMHANSLYSKLWLLAETLQSVREILNQAAYTLGNRLDPHGRLETCTPDEVNALHGEEQKGRALVACLYADADLARCLSETWFVLKGRFGWEPGPAGGPYEKSRGAQIAAHLIGLAKGMGLDWTRNNASPAHSACDAAATARMLPCAPIAVTARSVHAEIPMGYDGMEHVWRDACRDERLWSHMRTGVTLGKRVAQNRSKSVS